ncbi:MAG: hypothetical protein GXO79_12405 [Chlorobi bacterium]|nr:hypothetical protein [Chlorobiota bacterium]
MIGNAFHVKNKINAQKYLNSLSGLLLKAVQKSDSFATTLKYELEFVNNYLVLQKACFGGKLDFEINKEDDIDDSLEPPNMLIQIHIQQRREL